MSKRGRSVAQSLLARLDLEALFGVKSLPSSAQGDTLEVVAAEIHCCTECPLHKSRTNVVPGEGSGSSPIVFVGEGPGYEEDKQGRPFVGRAGQLLDKMLAAIDLPRPSVFIANVVKCRPPENRAPTPTEMVTCMPFLKRQLALIQPKIVCTLGSVAASALLGSQQRITAIRGKEFKREGYILIPTYHPAYLLRNPGSKREVWHDLQMIQRLLQEEEG